MIIKVDKIPLDSPLAAGMLRRCNNCRSELPDRTRKVHLQPPYRKRDRLEGPNRFWMASTQTTSRPAEVAGTDCDANVVGTDDQRPVVGIGQQGGWERFQLCGKALKGATKTMTLPNNGWPTRAGEGQGERRTPLLSKRQEGTPLLTHSYLSTSLELAQGFFMPT
jgi:hypothetical protein